MGRDGSFLVQHFVINVFGPEVLVKEQRVIVRPEPGILVGEIPECDGFDFVAVLAQGAEEVEVLPFKSGADFRREGGTCLVGVEVNSLLLFGALVRVCNMEVVHHLGIRCDGV